MNFKQTDSDRLEFHLKSGNVFSGRSLFYKQFRVHRNLLTVLWCVCLKAARLGSLAKLLELLMSGLSMIIEETGLKCLSTDARLSYQVQFQA